VYLSSASVYGDAETNLAIDESTPLAPTCYYGLAKVMAERVLAQAAVRAGVPLVVFRLCRLYGPGDTQATYGPSAFVRWILEEGAVTLFGDGKELRDHVWVGDLVPLVRAAAGGQVTGVVNLASGESRTYQEMVDSLRAIATRPFGVRSRERTRPRIDQAFDITRLRTVFPDVVLTGLEHGLRETWRAFAFTQAEGGQRT
jgi:UDP-glucose 4-epimerase